MPTTRQAAFEAQRYGQATPGDNQAALLEIMDRLAKLREEEAGMREKLLTTGGVFAQNSKDPLKAFADYMASARASGTQMGVAQAGVFADILDPMNQARAAVVARTADVPALEAFRNSENARLLGLPNAMRGSQLQLDATIQAIKERVGDKPVSIQDVATRRGTAGSDMERINGIISEAMGESLQNATSLIRGVDPNDPEHKQTFTALQMRELFKDQYVPRVMRTLIEAGLPEDTAVQVANQWAWGSGQHPGAVDQAVFSNAEITQPDLDYALQMGPVLAEEAVQEQLKNIPGGGLPGHLKPAEDLLMQAFTESIIGRSKDPSKETADSLRGLLDIYQEPDDVRIQKAILYDEARKLRESQDPYDRMIGEWSAGDPVTGKPPVIPGIDGIAAALGLAGDPYALQKTVEWFRYHPQELMALKKAYADPTKGIAGMLDPAANVPLESLQTELKAIGLPGGRGSFMVHDQNPAARKRLEAYVGPVTVATAGSRVREQAAGYKPTPNTVGAVIDREKEAMAAERAPAIKPVAASEMSMEAADAAAAAPLGSEAGASAAPTSSIAAPMEVALKPASVADMKMEPAQEPTKAIQPAATEMTMEPMADARAKRAEAFKAGTLKKLEDRLAGIIRSRQDTGTPTRVA